MKPFWNFAVGILLLQFHQNHGTPLGKRWIPERYSNDEYGDSGQISTDYTQSQSYYPSAQKHYYDYFYSNNGLGNGNDYEGLYFRANDNPHVMLDPVQQLQDVQAYSYAQSMGGTPYVQPYRTYVPRAHHQAELEDISSRALISLDLTGSHEQPASHLSSTSSHPQVFIVQPAATSFGSHSVVQPAHFAFSPNNFQSFSSQPVIVSPGTQGIGGQQHLVLLSAPASVASSQPASHSFVLVGHPQENNAALINLNALGLGSHEQHELQATKSGGLLGVGLLGPAQTNEDIDVNLLTNTLGTHQSEQHSLLNLVGTHGNGGLLGLNLGGTQSNSGGLLGLLGTHSEHSLHSEKEQEPAIELNLLSHEPNSAVVQHNIQEDRTALVDVNILSAQEPQEGIVLVKEAQVQDTSSGVSSGASTLENNNKQLQAAVQTPGNQIFFSPQSSNPALLTLNVGASQAQSQPQFFMFSPQTNSLTPVQFQSQAFAQNPNNVFVVQGQQPQPNIRIVEQNPAAAVQSSVMQPGSVMIIRNEAQGAQLSNGIQLVQPQRQQQEAIVEVVQPQQQQEIQAGVLTFNNNPQETELEKLALDSIVESEEPIKKVVVDVKVNKEPAAVHSRASSYDNSPKYPSAYESAPAPAYNPLDIVYPGVNSATPSSPASSSLYYPSAYVQQPVSSIYASTPITYPQQQQQYVVPSTYSYPYGSAAALPVKYGASTYGSNAVAAATGYATYPNQTPAAASTPTATYNSAAYYAPQRAVRSPNFGFGYAQPVLNYFHGAYPQALYG